MRHPFLKVLAFVATVLCLAQPAMAAEGNASEGLIKAAERAGVKLNQEQIVTATAPGVTFAGTSIAGFEQVPATALTKGADAGFIYLDAPETGIPAGYYRLNARADEPIVGNYQGTVGLIGEDGKEVARVPAALETSSLTVPNPLPYARTRLEAQISQNPREHRWPIVIIIYCPNGTIFIIWL